MLGYRYLTLVERTGTMPDTQQPQSVKFDLSFTPEVERYIEIYKKQGKIPSLEGFASRIGTDVESVLAWANKKKKDEQGNLTEQLARPHFYAAITKLQQIEKELTEKKESELNPKQELFCQLYATSREHFANGGLAYATAYGIDITDKKAYDGARTSASILLTNLKILERVDQLLGDLTDEIVDQELAYVIRQRDELPSKVAAIREYNKLKSRIIEKIDHTTKGKEMPTPIYGGKSTEQV